MQVKPPALRATLLFALVVVTSWLPSAAAEWLFDTHIVREPSLARPSPRPAPGWLDEKLPAPPIAPPVEQGNRIHRPIDLRGNEVVRPVARYEIDRRGGLYEVHSPETEFPRLAPPEM
jgi:hypothetical protein